MDLSSKKVLFVNLEKNSSEVKTFPDYNKYLGGYALALKIYHQYRDYKPTIFAVGPLNGLFPYVSKTAVVFKQDGMLKNIYLGGHLSTRMKFTGLDAIVIYGYPKEQGLICIEDENVTFKDPQDELGNYLLPGKSTVLKLEHNKILVDGYFGEPSNDIAKNFYKMKIQGLCVTGTKTIVPDNMTKYEEIYKSLVERTEEITVEKAFFPSCSGCPMGCENSKLGESDGDILLHSLVACEFSKNIYTNIGVVFSCLNTLGYDYTHEDIEAVPSLVQELLQELTI